MSNTNFDSDLDSFLNFDNDPSTASSSKHASLSHQSSYASASTPQVFPQPSYEYDSLKQQTGLPVGGLANTFAVNQATGLHYRPGSQFVMPTQTLNMPLSNLDEYDFNRFEGNDMDFDADSPTMYYGNNISPAQQAPPRIYPGMHTQQAAQAKIQQAQKQQQEIVRQQQQKQTAGQQSLPSQPAKISTSAKDPHVEESISRLLSRMRQRSDASAADEEDDELSGLPNVPKIKKDEDDMDDDERLLNSEEGKKLTSKERRQLRNKVSARAFRSRRKEYIGQLEAEVAQKVQEANDLRVQNRQLMEENTRLTDLTRMLLSSNSFSGFLQELSQSGTQPSSIPQLQQQRRQLQTQPIQQQPAASMQKDVPAHSAAQQMHLSQNMTVGMTLVPETPIDMSMFGGNPAWNNPIPSNDYQVFSVTELPEPPRLDIGALTGKKAEAVDQPAPKDIPVVSAHPASSPIAEPEQIVDDSVELDQDKHALFFNSTASESTTLTIPPRLFAQITKTSFLSVSQPSSGSWADLEKLCDGLDQSSERLAEFLPRS